MRLLVCDQCRGSGCPGPGTLDRAQVCCVVQTSRGVTMGSPSTRERITCNVTCPRELAALACCLDSPARGDFVGNARDHNGQSTDVTQRQTQVRAHQCTFWEARAPEVAWLARATRGQLVWTPPRLAEAYVGLGRSSLASRQGNPAGAFGPDTPAPGASGLRQALPSPFSSVCLPTTHVPRYS